MYVDSKKPASTLNTNPKKNWIYANGGYNFSEFRLSNGSFVLIENDMNEFQLSTGTCEKW